MPRSSQHPKPRNIPVRLIGATVAVGLHAIILAAIVSVLPGKIEVDLPETVEIHFVELSDEVLDAAPNEETAEPPSVEEVMDEPVDETPPEPEPIPEPQIEPDPIPGPVPEPEPIPEPEPTPEQIPEPVPEHEPIPEPEPIPDPEPLPEPE